MICDLAETYQIYDYRALPVSKLAVLVFGLREDSRVKMKMAKKKTGDNTILLASAVDRLSQLVWLRTKDGEKGRNRPEMIVANLFEQEQKENDIKAYDSAEEFELARLKLIEEVKNGN